MIVIVILVRYILMLFIVLFIERECLCERKVSGTFANVIIGVLLIKVEFKMMDSRSIMPFSNP